MKQKAVFLILTISTLLTGCCLKHEFSDANCTQPQTCVKCGETQGESLGHNFQEATCTEPKQCSICNVTEGEPLGHNFSEPTCTEASKCLVCNITQGQPLGHDFKEADYENPKTCELCGLTEGEPKEKPSPEDITMESSVEDMIAAYPDELTDEQQSKLDRYKSLYEKGGATEAMYKEGVYMLLYGPTKEEREAATRDLLQGLNKDNYNPGPEGALDGLTTTGQGESKPYDPNHKASDKFIGTQVY